jgi:YD repeat-containing protein
MQLAVSYDKSGNITTMFDPQTLKGNEVTFEYVPASGENHTLIELPSQFSGKPITQLGTLLRVHVNGGKPTLAAK